MLRDIADRSAATARRLRGAGGGHGRAGARRAQARPRAAHQRRVLRRRRHGAVRHPARAVHPDVRGQPGRRLVRARDRAGRPRRPSSARARATSGRSRRSRCPCPGSASWFTVRRARRCALRHPPPRRPRPRPARRGVRRAPPCRCGAALRRRRRAGTARRTGQRSRPCTRCWATTTYAPGRSPEQLVVELDGVRIGMVHDSGPTKGRPARMHRRFPTCGVVVFGHSHAPVDEPGSTVSDCSTPGHRRNDAGRPTRRSGCSSSRVAG